MGARLLRDGGVLARGIVVALVMLLAGCAGTPEGGTDAAPRSFADRIADQRVHTRIMTEVLSDPVLRHESHINVTVFDGVALLTGEVPGRAAGRRLARLAREDSGARHVYNELVVASLSSVFSRSWDRILTTSANVRIAALDEPAGLDPDRVHVVVERQRLYLLGRVSRDEADAVTEVVRHIGGVREVVRLFDYTGE